MPRNLGLEATIPLGLIAPSKNLNGISSQSQDCEARAAPVSLNVVSRQNGFSWPSGFHQAKIAGLKGLFTEPAAKTVVLLGNNRKKGR